LRLLEFELVELRLDDKEGRPLFHQSDLLQEALHPRNQVGGIDGGGVARRLDIAGDLLLGRERYRDLGRGRRHIAVLLPAGHQHDEKRDCDGGASGKKPISIRRRTNRHRATSTLIVQRRWLANKKTADAPASWNPHAGEITIT